MRTFDRCLLSVTTHPILRLLAGCPGRVCQVLFSSSSFWQRLCVPIQSRLVKILEAHLHDGPVDEADIEALRGTASCKEWSLKRLKCLCATGECDYLLALRQRALNGM